jgi:hypothetical protein
MRRNREILLAEVYKEFTTGHCSTGQNARTKFLNATEQDSLKTIWPVVTMTLRIDTLLPALR